MTKNVLLFGGTGMLGRELQQVFEHGGYRVTAPAPSDADIADQAAVFRAVRDAAPDVVLNAAVLVNVDACETDPARAYAVNALGPLFIADALRTLRLSKAAFVQFSSSDAFGGEPGAAPDESAAIFTPVNVYGRSKYYGERCVAGAHDGTDLPWYIIRSSWIYSKFKKTFVDTVADHVLRPQGTLAVIDDQEGVPTWGKDIAECAQRLIEERAPHGTYHAADSAVSKAPTRLEIAREIARLLGRDDPGALFVPASRAKVFAAPRPASSALRNTRIPAFPHWKDSLGTYLRAAYPQHNAT